MDVHGLLLKVHAKSTQSPHQVHTESMQVHSSIFPLLILSMDFYGLFKYFGLRVYKSILYPLKFMDLHQLLIIHTIFLRLSHG